MKIRTLSAALVLGLSLSSFATADEVGPAWPAPGGDSLTTLSCSFIDTLLGNCTSTTTESEGATAPTDTGSDTQATGS